MKRYVYAVAAILLVLVGVFVFRPGEASDVQKADKTKDYNFVMEYFHLSLPHDTTPVLNQADHDNFHGDGYRLLIFQLSAAGQENIVGQNFFASWSRLPMDHTLQEQLGSRLQIDGLTEWVDFEGMQGYYIILSKNYSYVISSPDTIGPKKQEMNEAFRMNDDLWRNIVVGVLDTREHQFIIYTWDS